MSELFEIFNDQWENIGLKERALVHVDGDWHRALEIHLVNPLKESIIFQQRWSDKDTEPSKLWAAAAGHYAPGESFSDGLREVKEEINLDVDEIVKNAQWKFYRIMGERTFVLMRDEIKDDKWNTLKKKILNREFQDIGILVSEIELSQLKMQREELDGLLEFRNQDIIDLFEGKLDWITHINWLLFDKDWEVIPYKPKIWRKEDFTFNLDSYYLKISSMVRDILSWANLSPDWKNFK